MIAELEKNIREIIHDEMRAYLVCGLDGRWRAKRAIDGECICVRNSRSCAAYDAMSQGYFFMY